MSQFPTPLRADADRNRNALLEAARALFALRGHEVPLEDIAREAGVSRTTLYRHFSTREQLAATVLEENVTAIEVEAQRRAREPDGARLLFDFVFDMQRGDQGFAYLLTGADVDWFTELSERTSRAFAPLVDLGHANGIVHPDVDVEDFLLAFPMASGVRSDAEAWQRTEAVGRVKAMLHRALFRS